MPCSIVREVIDIEALRFRSQHSEAGAVLIFCGDIRNHSQQLEVSFLEYEAHESMALKQISQVVEEAQKKWLIDKNLSLYPQKLLYSLITKIKTSNRCRGF